LEDPHEGISCIIHHITALIKASCCHAHGRASPAMACGRGVRVAHFRRS
jgi:hypothetical protein